MGYKNKRRLEKEKTKWLKELQMNRHKAMKERGGIDRKIAKLYLPWVCKRCGTTENLEVHHKFEKRPPGDLTNLEVLCSKCHHEVEWEKIILPMVRKFNRRIRHLDIEKLKTNVAFATAIERRRYIKRGNYRNYIESTIAEIKKLIGRFQKLQRLDPKINKVHKLERLACRLEKLYHFLWGY